MVDLSVPPVVRLLPEPGATKLTRAATAEAQRRRLLRAMVEVVAAKGYSHTSVRDVVSVAGVSRRTFYECFADKEACFLCCIDAGGDGLTAHLAVPADRELRAEELLDRMISRYLGLLAAEPAFAKAFLVDAFAAGPTVLARRYEHGRRFSDHLAAFYRLACVEGMFDADARPDVEMVAGAIRSLVTLCVALGDAEHLGELKDRLVGFIRSAGSGSGSGVGAGAGAVGGER